VLAAAFLIGISLPTAIGWLIVRTMEGGTPVLFRTERWALGFVLGTTATMFLAFVLNVTFGVPFTRWGFLLPQIIILAGLALFQWKYLPSASRLPLPAPQLTLPHFSLLIKSLIAILSIWFLLKLAAGAVLLTATPVYQDDVFNNWNMRGKLFFVHQELVLDIPLGNETTAAEGVSSYPPALPLMKTFLATVAGRWDDGLVNSIHILWYLATLVLVFSLLRRLLGAGWALVGTYILASLPLFLMHGIVPYADAFVAVHVLAAVGYLFTMLQLHQTNARALPFLRFSALATGLLLFTKNETLLLHLPPLLLVLACAIGYLRWRGTMSAKDVLCALAWYAGCIAVIAIPWLLFKWSHGLPFGNAKPIGGLMLAWQENVLLSIAINTFLEGNWLFLFPLLFCLLAVRRRRALASPLLVCTAFFLMVYAGQIALFLFTGLSTEVLRQTGYARGLLQIVPLAVVIATALLADTVDAIKKD